MKQSGHYRLLFEQPLRCLRDSYQPYSRTGQATWRQPRRLTPRSSTSVRRCLLCPLRTLDITRALVIVAPPAVSTIRESREVISLTLFRRTCSLLGSGSLPTHLRSGVASNVLEIHLGRDRICRQMDWKGVDWGRTCYDQMGVGRHGD